MNYSSKDVASYYNEFTKIYEQTTGDFIQAFRPANENTLMDYVARRLNIQPGLNLLDAGCGIGAPAIWLARNFADIRISCLTNSDYQYQKAQQTIREHQLDSRIRVTQGDYHHLEHLFGEGEFDRVMFLESLGHSHDPAKVMSGVGSVLRPGGTVYIKDFFQKKSRNPEIQQAIDEVIRVINAAYFYNTMDLAELVDAISTSDLAVEWIRKPALESDVTITIKLEHETQRLTYPHFMKTPAASWYEILSVKD